MRRRSDIGVEAVLSGPLHHFLGLGISEGNGLFSAASGRLDLLYQHLARRLGLYIIAFPSSVSIGCWCTTTEIFLRIRTGLLNTRSSIASYGGLPSA